MSKAKVAPLAVRWIKRLLLGIVVLVLFYEGWLFGWVLWWQWVNPETTRFMEIRLEELHAKDPKTRLQEYLQGRRLPLPKYVMMDTSGQAHLQQFRVCCELPALRICSEGVGPSRRAAEQMAAEKALEAIK